MPSQRFAADEIKVIRRRGIVFDLSGLYTDKKKYNGIHDLSGDTVWRKLHIEI